MPSRFRLLLLISTVLLAQAMWSYARHSGLSGLSPQFLQDYETASKSSSESKSAQPFIDLLSKYETGDERTELEVTLGMIHSQRSGFVDPAKAVEYFTEALARDLPEETNSKILLLRGNSPRRGTIIFAVFWYAPIGTFPVGGRKSPTPTFHSSAIRKALRISMLFRITIAIGRRSPTNASSSNSDIS